MSAFRMSPKTVGSKLKEHDKDQRLAVVIGASGDIGAALVKALSGRGYFVVCECGKILASRLSKLDGVCCATGIDISKLAGIDKLRSLIGETKIDVLVLNTHAEPIDDLNLTTEQLFDSMQDAFRRFAVGPTLVCHSLEPRLKTAAKVGVLCSSSGSFGQFSSTAQMMCMPGYSMSNMAAMAAQKTCVAHMEAWLKNKRVSMTFIHPGIIFDELSAVNGQLDTAASLFGTVITAEDCARICLEKVLGPTGVASTPAAISPATTPATPGAVSRTIGAAAEATPTSLSPVAMASANLEDSGLSAGGEADSEEDSELSSEEAQGLGLFPPGHQNGSEGEQAAAA